MEKQSESREAFQEQGGAATMDPAAPVRWATSKFLTRAVSATATAKRRARAEKARRKAGLPHRVEYFHQLDDGYSHLAAQLLAPLQERYGVELVCHLVPADCDKNLPEPELLLALSRLDAAKVAPHYGLHFPATAEAPNAASLALATQILAAIKPGEFAAAAVAVGNALWSGNEAELSALAKQYGEVDRAAAETSLASGSKRRSELGHYSGAMFHYGGEWYWGADRFYHLENRLIGYGARRDGASEPSEELICPRPAISPGPLKDDGSLTLEIYASLRSPYTSIIFDQALALAQGSGVRVSVKPVLPMVMRGVPVTRQKGFYIFTDTAREAAALGLEWGNFFDPIGEPARNAYSLYPWACRQGKGAELLSAFLRAAFFDGVNTNNNTGMRHVVERAGLPWGEAESIMGNKEWEAELEANRLAMYDFGCWGVPSFRLLDAGGEEVLGLWGQDRLWLFAREIQRLLREAPQGHQSGS